MAESNKKISILQEDPGCTYKNCRKSSPSRQHSSRRHADIPYQRRVNGKVVKFIRSGQEGDEERPFKCYCHKEYQNTRSLADHLTAGCEVFNSEIKRELNTAPSRTDSPLSNLGSSPREEHTIASKAEIEYLSARLEQMAVRVEVLENEVQYYRRGQYPQGLNQVVCHYNKNSSGYYDEYPIEGGYDHDNSYNDNYNNKERHQEYDGKNHYYFGESEHAPPAGQYHGMRGQEVPRVPMSSWSNGGFEKRWCP